MNKFIFLLLVFYLIFGSYLFAGDYKVNITRKGPNLYKVEYKNLYIKTSSCYEYVYYENAILSMNGYKGQLYFSNRNSCPVIAVYGQIDVNPGKYNGKLVRENDGFYSIYGTDLYILTDACIQYAYLTDVVIEVNAYGGGIIYFSQQYSSFKSTCFFNGIFQKIKL